MKKILNIAWKDFLITLSDPAALALTLATPFALTLIMIFAFGDVNDGGFTNIPVVIVNHDESDFGAALVEVFESDELAELVTPFLMEDAEAARVAVDNEEFSAAIIIPENLGTDLIPGDLLSMKFQPDRESATIEIYGNPTRPTSVNILRTIVDEFISRASALVFGMQVSIVQMSQTGLFNDPDMVAKFADEFSGGSREESRMINLNESMAEGSLDTEFDWFGYIAPSMALLFLMFTISNGGRSILAENEGGTLPRMLTTPSNPVQVLGGKVLGIYVNGVAQLAVLFVASLVMLGINWGSPSVVIPTILCVVAAATGWGMLIAAFSKTPGQAAIFGTAITLIFAIGSGSFFPRQYLPQWLQYASLVSPNAWGIEAFTSIRMGAAVWDLIPLWGGMLGIFATLFATSVLVFRRQYS